MKTIIKQGKPIYKDVLVGGIFRCRRCGCEFKADQEDIDFQVLYGMFQVVEKTPYSCCPQCGESSELIEGRYEKIPVTEEDDGE